MIGTVQKAMDQASETTKESQKNEGAFGAISGFLDSIGGAIGMIIGIIVFIILIPIVGIGLSMVFGKHHHEDEANTDANATSPTTQAISSTSSNLHNTPSYKEFQDKLHSSKEELKKRVDQLGYKHLGQSFANLHSSMNASLDKFKQKHLGHLSHLRHTL